SYFEPGLHTTEVWYDVVDGRRPAPELQLEPLDDLPWAEWPGRWGDTPSRVATIDQPSPMAPCEHRQWDDPAKLLKDAVEHDVAGVPSAARPVRFDVVRDGGFDPASVLRAVGRFVAWLRRSKRQ